MHFSIMFEPAVLHSVFLHCTVPLAPYSHGRKTVLVDTVMILLLGGSHVFRGSYSPKGLGEVFCGCGSLQSANVVRLIREVRAGQG